MATDTEPTSLQTGVTPEPISANTQDFSDSDDEILDNFADGPDDNVPMGLGGEKGKQSEPASSTLESDIVNGTKQPGEKLLPSEDTIGGSEPVEPADETGTETSPEPPEEPETPEFPPMLLQMAGLPDAKAAHAAGFADSESLLAAIKWRSQLLAPGALPAETTQPSGQNIYRRTTPEAVPPTSVPAKVVEPPPDEDFTPFQLPAEQRERLDEDLLSVLDQMNQHYQQRDQRQQAELKSLRSSLEQRETVLARQREEEEDARFDKAVAGLGSDWQDVFGEGSGAELSRSGRYDPVAMTNLNHRVLLYETVQAVREVNAKQGYKPMTLEQEMHWALMQRYPDKFQQIVSGNSNGNSGRRTASAHRPTQRKTPPKSQNAATIDAVDAMLRKKHGYALSRTPRDEEFDGEI